MPKKQLDADILIAKLDLFKDHLDAHMVEVKGTLVRVDERLDTLSTTSGKQQVILEEHVRRTDLLEKKLNDDVKTIDEKIEPIKTHVTQVKFLLKIAAAIAAAGGLGGVGVGIKQLIGILFDQ